MESLKDNEILETFFEVNFVQFLELLFKDYPEGIVYRDKDFNFKFLNKAYCNFFKIYNKENILNNNDTFFLSKENSKLVRDANQRILSEKQGINYFINHAILPDDEKIFHVSTIPVCVKNEFNGILSVIRDVTEEESIKEKFVLRHTKLESLLSNIPMIIYMQDKHSNYITGTRHAENFLNSGFDLVENIKLLSSQVAEENFKENKYVAENNSISVKTVKILDIESSPHWYKVYKIPINDFDSEVTKIITIIYNVDKEIRLQSQRETFVATISHDLKNPTIAQIRSLELILKGMFGEVNKEQRELLEMILDSCRYMNGMLSSLLATYRDYSGIIKLKFQEFSLRDLVNECVSEMLYVAKDKDIKILINDSGENDKVNADRVQIKRVIMNLISNGIKYAVKNTELKLYIENVRGKMYFKFKNSSPYIPKDKQKNLFAKYVTYSQNQKELGIGLGLYASQKIIEAHKGKMFVESFKNNKNIFGFYIPSNLSSENNNYEVFL